MSSTRPSRSHKVVDVLRRAGAFDRLTLVGLGPAGSLAGVPAPLGGRRARRGRPARRATPWPATWATSCSWPSRSR